MTPLADRHSRSHYLSPLFRQRNAKKGIHAQTPIIKNDKPILRKPPFAIAAPMMSIKIKQAPKQATK